MEPQAMSSWKEPGPRTLASSFPSAIGSTEPKSAQSGSVMKGLWACPVSPLPLPVAIVLATVTFLFQYYLTATSNRLHNEGCANP